MSSEDRLRKTLHVGLSLVILGVGYTLLTNPFLPTQASGFLVLTKGMTLNHLIAVFLSTGVLGIGGSLMRNRWAEFTTLLMLGVVHAVIALSFRAAPIRTPADYLYGFAACTAIYLAFSYKVHRRE